jgi:hypothetical protein
VADARYFRSQAELYLELSRRMSLHGDAEYFRVVAGRHLTAANELEREGATSTTALAASSSTQANEG